MNKWMDHHQHQLECSSQTLDFPSRDVLFEYSAKVNVYVKNQSRSTDELYYHSFSLNFSPFFPLPSILVKLSWVYILQKKAYQK